MKTFSTPSKRLTFARLAYAGVVLREQQIAQANHDVYTLENVVDDLREDYGNRAGLECLVEDRERIQRAHDRLAELLAKIGTEQMQAAE